MYNLMSYLIPFYVLTLFSSSYVYLILTPWFSDPQHTPLVSLCLLVSGTKYSHTLRPDINLFDLFIIRFDWDDSHDRVSKLFKATYLHRIDHKTSYHIICGAPLYIKLLLTDTVGYEKEMNLDVLGVLAT